MRNLKLILIVATLLSQGTAFASVGRADFCARPSRYLCDPVLNQSPVRAEAAEEEIDNKWGFQFRRSSPIAQSEMVRMGFSSLDTLVPAPKANGKILSPYAEFIHWANQLAVDDEISNSERELISAAFLEFQKKLLTFIESRRTAKNSGNFDPSADAELDLISNRITNLRFSFLPTDESTFAQDASVIGFTGSKYGSKENLVYIDARAMLTSAYPKFIRFVLAHEMSHVITSSLPDQKVATALRNDVDTAYRHLSLAIPSDIDTREVMADWYATPLIHDSPSPETLSVANQALVDVSALIARPEIQDLTAWTCGGYQDSSYYDYDEGKHINFSRRLDEFLLASVDYLGCPQKP
jgi:hypothetical protein